MTKKKLVILLTILFLIFLVTPALAKYTASDSTNFLQTTAGQTGVDTVSSWQVILGKVVQIVLAVAGVVFFIFMFLGGYRWLLSRGNEETVTKAKGTITASIIGFIVVAGSFAITSFFLQGLIGDGLGDTTLKPGSNTLGNENLGCCINQVQRNYMGTIGAKHWVGCMTTQIQCQDSAHNCMNDTSYIKISEQFISEIKDSLACQNEAERRRD